MKGHCSPGIFAEVQLHGEIHTLVHIWKVPFFTTTTLVHERLYNPLLRENRSGYIPLIKAAAELGFQSVPLTDSQGHLMSSCLRIKGVRSPPVLVASNKQESQHHNNQESVFHGEPVMFYFKFFSVGLG